MKRVEKKALLLLQLVYDDLIVVSFIELFGEVSSFISFFLCYKVLGSQCTLETFEFFPCRAMECFTKLKSTWMLEFPNNFFYENFKRHYWRKIQREPFKKHGKSQWDFWGISGDIFINSSNLSQKVGYLNIILENY